MLFDSKVLPTALVVVCFSPVSFFECLNIISRKTTLLFKNFCTWLKKSSGSLMEFLFSWFFCKRTSSTLFSLMDKKSNFSEEFRLCSFTAVFVALILSYQEKDVFK